MQLRKLKKMKNVYNPLQGKLDKIKDYLIGFFGEKYREVIEERLNNTSYIFCENKEDDELVKYFDKAILRKLTDFASIFDKKFKFCGEIESADQFLLHLENLDKWIKKTEEEDYKSINNFLSKIEFKNVISKNETIEDILKDKEKEKLFYSAISEISEAYNAGVKGEIEKIKKQEYNMVFKNWEEDTLKLKRELKLDVCDIIIKSLKIPFTEENVKIISKHADAVTNYYKDWSPSVYDEKKFIMATDELMKISTLDLLEFERVLDVLKYDIMFKVNEFNTKEYALKNGFAFANKMLEENFSENISNEMKKSLNNNKTQIEWEEFNGCVDYAIEGDNLQRVCIVGAGSSLQNITIIHEICHAVQMSGHEKNGAYFMKTGVLVANKEAGETKEINNNLTNLNEVLNEYFSLSILKQMKNDNFEIGPKGFDIGPCHYRSPFIFLKDFIKDNLATLIDVCMSEDKNQIYDAFGKENLLKLDKKIEELFNFYIKQCGCKKYEKSLSRAIENVGGRDEFYKLVKEGEIKGSQSYKEYLDFFTDFYELNLECENYSKRDKLCNECE